MSSRAPASLPMISMSERKSRRCSARRVAISARSSLKPSRISLRSSMRTAEVISSMGEVYQSHVGEGFIGTGALAIPTATVSSAVSVANGSDSAMKVSDYRGFEMSVIGSD